MENTELDEISGLQSSPSRPDTWFLHNDDGAAKLFVMDSEGRDRGSFLIEGAANRDWEDISAFRSDGQGYLLIADSGDNFAQWDEISLYIVSEPEANESGRYSGRVPLHHHVRLRYPDGARDCEAVAVDPARGQVLFLTKRDMPPRIYGIDLDRVLSETEAELEFLGEAHTFRPPTAADMLEFGPRDGRWVSQPTGFDISPDGSIAAVISYRSLYLFEKPVDQSWAEALAGEPTEFTGPPARKEEAVAFSPGGDFVLVTTEGIPAPLFRLPVETVGR